MELYEDNGAAGSIPEFGAIFMSNIATKKECFRKKVFGLPSSQANFVKQVKVGMVLFLFEYEKRELFGVYQACSDGAMDIEPRLCNNLGKKFPAQVQFRPIWYCNPLTEKEFRDAICDNYFSAKKFNFGLSEEQVNRLLLLFRRKLKNRLPRPPLRKLINRAVGEKRKLLLDDRLALAKRGDIQPSEDDMFESGIPCNYLRTSREADEDIPFMGEKIDTEDELNSLAHDLSAEYVGDCLDKRTDNDGRLLRNDLPGNRLHVGHGTSKSFGIGRPEDALDNMRRLDCVEKLVISEFANDQFREDGDLDPVHFKQYPVGPLNMKTADVCELSMTRTVGGFDSTIGFGSAFSTEHHVKSLNRSQLGNDDMFFLGDRRRKECNHRRTVEPVVFNDGDLDERLENRQSLDCVSRFVSASEHVGPFLHKVRNTTGDDWFALNGSLCSEPNMHSRLGASSFVENFENPFNLGSSSINDSKISTGGITESYVDSIRCSTTLNKKYGYVTGVKSHVADDCRFRSDNQAEIGDGADILARPLIMTDYPLSMTKQKSLLQPNISQPTSHDAVASTEPYIPKVMTPNRRFNSISVYGNPSSVEENPCHRFGGNHNFISRSHSPKHGLDAIELSRHLDNVSAYENKTVLPTLTDHPSYSLCRTPHYSLNSPLSSHLNLDSSVSLSSGSLPALRFESSERDKRLASYKLNSMENPSVGRYGKYPSISQDIHQHFIYPEVDKTLAKQDLLCSVKQDSSIGMFNQEEDSFTYDKGFKSSKEEIINYEEHYRLSKVPRRDCNSNRRSVFTRLTSGPEAPLQEKEENNDYVCYDEGYTDSSVNEVMDLLQQMRNNGVSEVKKIKKRKSVHAQQDNRESDLDERRSCVGTNREMDQSISTKRDKCGAIDGNSDEVPRETRAVDFRRRSETKKDLVESSAKTNPPIAESAISSVNTEVNSLTTKSCKRRKLVRPIFSKNDSSDEDSIVAKMPSPDIKLRSVILKGIHELCGISITSRLKLGAPRILKIGSSPSRSNNIQEGKETV